MNLLIKKDMLYFYCKAYLFFMKKAENNKDKRGDIS